MKLIFQVTLYDDMHQSDSFFATFSNDGFKQSQPKGTNSHTVLATITPINQNFKPISIDGDGWRDIDAADALSEFIKKVVIDQECGDAFFENLAKEVGVSETQRPGSVVCY